MKKTRSMKAGVLAIASLFIVMAFASTVNAGMGVAVSKRIIPVPPTYNILWSRLWTDGNQKTSGRLAPTTDSERNIYVTGYTNTYGPVLMKYSPTGTLIWMKQIDVAGITSATPVDLSEYTNGDKGGNGQGVFQFEKQVGDDDEDTSFYFDWIGTSSDNTIVIRAELDLHIDSDTDLIYTTFLKYDTNGNQIWNETFGFFGFLLSIGPSAIDSSGCIFTQCFSLFGDYLLKVYPDGNLGNFAYTSLIDWVPLGCALDSNQDIISILVYDITFPDSAFLVTKQSHDDQTMIDENIIPVTLSTTYIWGSGIAVDKTDNSFFFTLFDKIFKFDSSLNKVWEIPYNYCGGWLSDYYASGVCMYRSSIIISGGMKIVNNQSHYVAVMLGKRSGNTQMVMDLGLHCPNDLFDMNNQMNGLCLDSNNDVVFSGGSYGIKTIKVHINYGIDFEMEPQVA